MIAHHSHDWVPFPSDLRYERCSYRGCQKARRIIPVERPEVPDGEYDLAFFEGRYYPRRQGTPLYYLAGDNAPVNSRKREVAERYCIDDHRRRAIAGMRAAKRHTAGGKEDGL